MLGLCYQVATPEVYHLPGITSYHGDLHVAFRFLKECGYNDVELMVRNPKEINLFEIEKEVKGAHFTVPMICTGEIYGQDKLSFADPNPEIRQEAINRVKAAIDMAAIFGKMINLGRVRGGFYYDVPKEVTYNRILDAILEIIDYASKKGVTIALEPVNTLGLNFINTTIEGIEFVKQINSPFFMLMIDTAHMFIEDKDINKSVYNSSNYLVYVHLADSNRKYPGAGNFNFKHFFDLLRKINYNGWLSVEVFPIPDQNTSVIRSFQYIRPFLNKI